MTLSDHRCASRLHGDPYLRDIDGHKSTAIFTGEYTAGVNSLSAPAIKAKNPIGLRDGEPSFDIREFATIGLARADLPAIEVSSQRMYEKPIIAPLRSILVRDLKGQRLRFLIRLSAQRAALAD